MIAGGREREKRSGGSGNETELEPGLAGIYFHGCSLCVQRGDKLETCILELFLLRWNCQIPRYDLVFFIIFSFLFFFSRVYFGHFFSTTREI